MFILSDCACSSKHQHNTSPHHDAFFRTEWYALHNARQNARQSSQRASSQQQIASQDPSREGPQDISNDSIRDAIVYEAIMLLKSAKKSDLVPAKCGELDDAQNGANDVANIYKKIGCPKCWRPDDDTMDLSAYLAKEATRLHAWRTKEKPQAGDIILFHNQVDRNCNGKSDDWFTGVAIVIESGRHTQTAVTRTGGVVRKIVISPRGPMVRTYKGRKYNSFVRIPGPHDPVDAQYLSGQLYAGFIDSYIVVARKIGE